MRICERSPTICAVDVAVYFCSIDNAGVNDPTRLATTLTEQEQQHALRFHRVCDRLRYCTGRLLMRTILAKHVRQAPSHIELKTGPRGKPFVEHGPSFNLSHSGPAVLLAIADNGDLGVDVELVRPLEDLDDLAHRCFSAAELEALESRSGIEKTQAFFRTWTRKEAFIKALGGGLSIDLKRFSVSIEDREDNVLVDASACTDGRDQWCIRPVRLPGDFAAAVALNVDNFSVSLIEWEADLTKT